MGALFAGEQVAYLQAFVGSMLLALALCPVARRLALRLHLLDCPDGCCKRQAAPVPYLGGPAVFVAFLVPVALLADWDGPFWALMLGATAMVGLGLLDDLRPLVWWQKMPLELLICTVACRQGLCMQHDLFPLLGAQAVSIIWLLLAVNAVNMLDVADGLASCVALTAATALASLCGILSHGGAALTSLALGGACLGFLPYNRAPARLYLGDAGSLFIGFTLGGISLLADYSGQPPLAALAPVAILVVPLLDIALVALARLSHGATPDAGSSDHVAMRLRRHGWSADAVAGSGALLSLVAATLALLLALLPGPHALVVVGLGSALLTALFMWVWQLQGSAPPAARPRKREGPTSARGNRHLH